MKRGKHKVIMGLIILFGLLAIFSSVVDDVSAASPSTVYVSKQGNDNWNGLSSTHTSGVKGPKATIKKAVSIVASGGKVYIAKGTYKENNININKNVALLGADQQKTIVNGAKKGRIFLITSSSAKVTLSKLTIANGYSKIAAGAIENRGTLTVKSCTFTNNTVTGTYGDGGAIVNKATLKVESSNFISNSAYYGGAIYNMKTATITKSKFTKNTAKDTGGAISNYLYGLTITGCTFTSNKATYAGGAIQSLGKLRITGSNFTSNTVPGTDGNGGAIESQGTINLENCTFTGNTVTPNVTTSQGLLAYGDNGGAISTMNKATSVNTFTNVKFINNNAPYGGAINNYSGTLNLVKCTFKGNKACVNGAAIQNEGKGILNVTSSTFTDNVATWGSAIFNCYKTTVKSSTFINNRANNAGGALVNQGVSFTVTSCTFTNNRATNNGGAVANIATMNINKCTFKNSSAKFVGGAIDNQGKLTITGSTFTGNTLTGANSNGGAIENQGTLSVSSTTFSNNKAYWGGAISNIRNTLTVTGCTFSSNKATRAGGAIENQAKLTVKSSKFTGNSVTSGAGGAIFSNGPTCNVNSSNTFSKNTAASGSNIYRG